VIDRRRLLLTSLAASLTVALAAPALAQDTWPAKPITIVVPFAAGGTSDVLARTIGAQLQIALKQTVIVDNKGGAGGVIGAGAVAKAAPDGYPLLLAKMPYNAAKDFAPVMLLGSISNVLLVGPDQPFKSVKDVIAAAKAKPGTLQFASAGQGTSQHMSGETFKLLTGTDLIHIPYKGSAPAIQDVMGGAVPMSFETALVAGPQIKAGKVRALAVTSAKRTRILPDVPTLQEAGVAGFDVASWQALYAPAGTPVAIVTRLNAELAKIVAQPETKAKMEALGLEYTPNTPAQFGEFQAAEQAKWAKIVKDGNVKPE